MTASMMTATAQHAPETTETLTIPNPTSLRRRKRVRRHRSRRPQQYRQDDASVLRFSPTAWAKLLFLRDYGETEIGAFGISSEQDLLCVDDICLVRQDCSLVSVLFDDAAVAGYFDEQVDTGLRPEQFGRIWVHTHPGDSAAPSETDEETFRSVFGRCDWSVMFILARGGESFARLQFGVGPGGSILIPVAVDWTRPFAAADPAAWETEYQNCIRPQHWFTSDDDQLGQSPDVCWREPEATAS